ncbi:MAG TPA: hypothetical protein DCZ01_00160 [Elusimicrobia bacterium]|nr:MAG: hypothetical protein A2X37_08605 [Elusimicrobia bacterium GWA2_66_18]OGR69750.1 MAG: hypothetical protein A2X40_09975 [Elusimicrobia bacterium GWC2_65_9]HAZ06947.1 hypothetical protein [Elusimicrobiota bacterium]
MQVRKVLVVDSSQSFQDWLSQVLAPASGVQISLLCDGTGVVEAVQDGKPDVLILDMFMPPQDGLVVLDKVMRRSPVPVIMFAELDCPDDSELFQEAYDRGARMVLAKPRTVSGLWAMAKSLQDMIVRLADIPLEKLVIDYLNVRKNVIENPRPWAARKAVGIISSTGAVEVLRDLLLKLPDKLPAGVLVAQHMYAPVWLNFTDSLARKTSHPMSIARGGEIVREGRILLSPTAKTLLIQRTNCGRISRLEAIRKFETWQIPLQPHLDAFLKSLAEGFGPNAIAIVLSGMGEGGVKGSQDVRDAGGQVWVQDPRTASAPSMPEAVLKGGFASRVCAPAELSSALDHVAESWINTD